MAMPDLPSEVWFLIFELVDNPAHILNIVLASKAFYELAIKSLYRHLLWEITRESLATRSYPTWLETDDPMDGEDGPMKPSTPLSCTIREHYNLPSNYSTYTDSYPAQWAAYKAHTARIASFANLRTLTFDHTCVPNPLFEAIPGLPHLRHLCLKNVFFGFPYTEKRFAFADHHHGNNYGLMDLSLSSTTIKPVVDLRPSSSITELTLSCCMRDSHRLSTTPYIQIMRCFIRPQLRILRIDWCSTTARYLAKQLEHVEVDLPTELEVLELRLPKVKAWSEGSSLWTLLQPLAVFLKTSCQNMRQFVIAGHLPTVNLESISLPHLVSYVGPMAAALSLVNASQGRVREVVVTDQDETVPHLTSFLCQLALASPAISSLDIQVLEWDIEIFHAIVQLFPNLTSMSIRYKQGYPSENALVSFGPQFLSRMANLVSFHIYNTLEPLPSIKRGPFRHGEGWMELDFDFGYHHHMNSKPAPPALDYKRPLGPCGGSDEDIIDILIPWKRYSPTLTEVRFLREWVWRRVDDRDRWCKRRLEPDWDWTEKQKTEQTKSRESIRDDLYSSDSSDMEQL